LPVVRVLENQIPALSRTFRHIFEDFQGPCLFSRTFQALEIWKNYSETFKDFQGGAENDGPSKCPGMKMTDMKLTDMKMQDMFQVSE